MTIDEKSQNIKETRFYDPNAAEKDAEVIIESSKLNELKRLARMGLWAEKHKEVLIHGLDAIRMFSRSDEATEKAEQAMDSLPKDTP